MWPLVWMNDGVSSFSSWSKSICNLEGLQDYCLIWERTLKTGKSSEFSKSEIATLCCVNQFFVVPHVRLCHALSRVVWGAAWDKIQVEKLLQWWEFGVMRSESGGPLVARFKWLWQVWCSSCDLIQWLKFSNSLDRSWRLESWAQLWCLP